MSASTSKILVIVDGYSSGSQLPSILREHGWSCIHVRSVPVLSPYYLTAFREDDYLEHFVHADNGEEIARRLAKYEPAALVPGTESGVVVADLLAAALGLPGNDPSTSNARRDKYEMHNRLKASGLRAMDHHLAASFDDLLDWANAGDWPVVVKPQSSGGTDGVTFCRDRGELEEAFHRILGATNRFGQHNDAVLAQRLLTGQEYFINGVSGNGRHVITEIWRADKVPAAGAGMIYDRSVLIDPTEPEMQPIVGYLGAALDALGVRYGAHHSELMVTDRGPTLIECGSRLSGGLNRAAANYAVGVSQLDLVARLAVEGEQYVERLYQERARHRHPLWQVQFVSHATGVVARSCYDDLMAALQSRTWLQKAPRPGDPVTRTTDLFSSPGLVFMSHPDAEVLQQDYETIRRWEREDRLFVLE